jgi:mevalonate kinase
MTTISVAASAPGKLMLFGEHAVVYGAPCIVTAIDGRTYAEVSPDDTEIIVLKREGYPTYRLGSISSIQDKFRAICNFDKKHQFVVAALRQFWNNTSCKFGATISTWSDFREGGLGSSSAVTVALVKALFEVSGQQYNLKKIFDLSYAAVKDVQGKASGFDVAAATYGGILRYQQDKPSVSLQEQIGELPLFVVNSGVKASTTEYIDKVECRKNKEPELIRSIINKVESLVNDVEKVLLRQDFEEAGVLMNRNHDLLKQLDVSIDVLDLLVTICNNSGAYGAKLSGAGGGDCIISLVPPECKRKLEEEVNKVKGVRVESIQVGEEGVRIEN